MCDSSVHDDLAMELALRAGCRLAVGGHGTPKAIRDRDAREVDNLPAGRLAGSAPEIQAYSRLRFIYIQRTRLYRAGPRVGSLHGGRVHPRENLQLPARWPHWHEGPLPRYEAWDLRVLVPPQVRAKWLRVRVQPSGPEDQGSATEPSLTLSVGSR